MNFLKISNRKTFFLLWALCIIGYWALLPYVQYLQVLPTSISIWSIALMGTIQIALVFGLLCWISFKIYPKTDLNPFPPVVKRSIITAVISGILIGLTLFIANKTIFQSSSLTDAHPPFWAGMLASIYGAVNEEVSLRFFLFTLIYFVLRKWVKIEKTNRLIILWSINIFVALLFGIGHLPAAFKLGATSAFEVFRILFLNGIAGVVFGWLYWSRGLWIAIAAHFVADLMIHVFLI